MSSQLKPRSDIQFVEDEHRYFVGGGEYLSLHAVLEAAGLIPQYRCDSVLDAMARGRLVHQMLEYEDKMTLDPSSVDPSVAGYLNAWMEAKKESEIEIMREWIETMAANDDLRVSCRLDRLVKFGNKMAVLDIKTGAAAKWHRLQTAGQAICLGDNGKTPKLLRFICYLDGHRWKLVEHDDPTDYVVFRAAAQVAWWKKST